MKNKLIPTIAAIPLLGISHAQDVTGTRLNVGYDSIFDSSVLNSGSVGYANDMYEAYACFAAGYYNWTSNSFGSVMLGGENQLSFVPNGTMESENYGSVLIGIGNSATESSSWAFGKGNIGQADTVTLGTYAQTVSGASLIVGKGTSSSGRSNGLVVLKNGEVQISGSLVVGGSPVLSQGSASSFLQSQGFVNTSYLSSNGYLKRATGTNASVGTSSLMAIGNSAQASGSSSLAIGNGASAVSGAISLGEDSFASGPYAVALQGGQAYGEYSLASGWGYAVGKLSLGLVGGWASEDSAVAIGGFDEAANWANEAGAVGSVAIGGATNSAWGDYSYALGWNSITVGKHSYSIGYGTRTNAYQISMGSRNLSSQNQMPNMSNDQWLENGALFELGNGDPTQSNPIVASNAITTLKNGQTTLINKAWKANAASPLADPPATNTDSGGNALVVDGHTVLNGKVIIAVPQGDISMGIYGN